MVNPLLQMPRFWAVLLIIIQMLVADRLAAQTLPPQTDTIILSTVSLSVPVLSATGFYAGSNFQISSQPEKNLPSFIPLPKNLATRLPASYVSKAIYLKLSIRNDADSARTVFLLPGFYCRVVNLYRFNRQSRQFESVELKPLTEYNSENFISKLELAPLSTGTFITELKFIKTSMNTIDPLLVQEFYLPTLLNQLHIENRVQSTITYMICGIMLMMIFYSLGGYYSSRRIDFLYYAAYAFLLGNLFFFKAFLFRLPVPSNFFFESYLDFILQASGIIFYFKFIRSFIESGKKYPVINKILITQQIITFLGLLVFTWLNFFTDNFQFQNQVENTIKYTWSFITIVFIFFAFNRPGKILHYLAIGHLFLLFFGFISLFLIAGKGKLHYRQGALLYDSLFWYEMGVLLELVFFMIALAYKDRQDITLRVIEKERLMIAYEKSAIERKMEILAAQQEERDRISTDMHDELGSGITTIRLLSELTRSKMKDPPSEIEKISNSANDLITKMNTIIWTLKSSNDTVENMVAYMRAFATEFLDSINLAYRVDFPDHIAPIELSGEKRRNIFLCIKEALNNIAKHARATDVHINFQVGSSLLITIRDNGIGLHPEKMREFSNGLANMKKRMQNIDGQFNITNDEGTIVTLSIPL